MQCLRPTKEIMFECIVAEMKNNRRHEVHYDSASYFINPDISVNLYGIINLLCTIWVQKYILCISYLRKCRRTSISIIHAHPFDSQNPRMITCSTCPVHACTRKTTESSTHTILCMLTPHLNYHSVNNVFIAY